jgi:L-threonylcarbamoyladenylate synthase
MRVIGSAQLDQAAASVKAGGLVIVPTRRWYMICADARNSEACGRIYSGKQRPPNKPLALVLSSRESVRKPFVLNSDADRLIEAFWPGDLALMLPWRRYLDRRDGAVERCGAVGTPNALVVHESGVLGELAALADVPIAATTANISGVPGGPGTGPAISLNEVRGFLEESRIDVTLCVEGGICPTAHHLTIVDCTGHDARILRTGLVHQRAIEVALK